MKHSGIIHPYSVFKALAFIMLGMLAVSGPLQGATRTWTGASISDPTPANRNNLWSNQLNWSPVGFPTTTEDLVFGASSQSSSNNTFAVGTTFNSLTDTSGHIMLGNGVALNAGLTASGGAQILLGSIKLNLNQTFNAPTAGSAALLNSAIDTNGKTLTFDGPGNYTVTGAIGGGGGLKKKGVGTVTLLTSNSYVGNTSVQQGTLLVNGSQPQSEVSISGSVDPGEPGGTLGGTGTVGAINVGSDGAIIDPGAAANSTGILTTNGSLIYPLSGVSSLTIDIKGTTPGSGYDRLNVGSTGTLDLGDANLLNVIIGGGFVPAPGDSFLIINNAGPNPVVGQFLGKAEGQPFTVGSTTFVVSYKGGDGNDVILRVPITCTWVGGGADNNWMTAANWTNEVAPQAGDSLVFPANATQKTNVNNFPADTSFGALTISGSAGIAYDISGNAIKLTTGLMGSGDSSNASAVVRLVVGGPGGVTALSGNLFLKAPNTYTGPTIVDGGQLFVDGDQPNKPVTLNAGFLRGKGTVGAVTAGSTSNAIAPGSFEIGTRLRVVGNVTLTSGTSFTVADLQTLQVAGTVNLGSARLSKALNAASVPAVGTTIVIIDNDGTEPIIGTFSSRPEGTVYQTFNPSVFLRVSYVGGDGNDVTLTRVDPPTLSIDDVTVTEGNTGTVSAIFTVTLSYVIAEGTVNCGFSTADGTATTGSDYVAKTIALQFSGTKSTTVGITVNGDTASEPDETFFVNLSSPVNATIAKGQGTCTIRNDDAAPAPTPSATPTAPPTGTPTPTPGSSATPTPTPAKALNIATRLRVETGDNVMIAGFIITGNASKEVVLRGMGPILGNFGINGFLADPMLELRGPGGSILKDDNWKDTQRAQIEGGPLQPGDDRESVIVATLAPDSYTAILTGKNDTTGVGLIEVYDNTPASDSQLGNISTRGLVQGSDSVMIGGFILGGSGNNSRVAIRGIGPSLAQFGLNNVLVDPTLELHDGNGATLISNDDWESDPVSAGELTANGLALSDAKESGIFASLPPGPFTAILAGKNGGSGIGLIEIYNLE